MVSPDNSSSERLLAEGRDWGEMALSLFRARAEIAGRYLRKGSQVYVEGRLRTRKWIDQAGMDRYTTDIAVDELKLLGRRPEGADANDGPATDPAPARSGLTPPPREPATAGGAGDFDDDIPFAGPAALDGLVFPYDGA